MNAPIAPPTRLRRRLADPKILVAPGVYDGLTALLAERAGFEALYMTGAGVANSRFGLPDIGLVGMKEVADTLAAVAERATVPVIVDGDTGFGNALNVARTVRMFERLGASAIQLEDQTLPKRCGHLADKTLIPGGEMVGKIKAALDARASDQFVVIARTDAIAAEGFEQAMERAAMYREAGADMLFVEAPRSREEMARLTGTLGGDVPLMANMVEGGRTPLCSAEELEELGFALVIFPGGTVRWVIRALSEYFSSLAEHGTNAPLRDRMLQFDELQEVVGTADMLAAGKRYDEGG